MVLLLINCLHFLQSILLADEPILLANKSELFTDQVKKINLNYIVFFEIETEIVTFFLQSVVFSDESIILTYEPVLFADEVLILMCF